MGNRALLNKAGTGWLAGGLAAVWAWTCTYDRPGVARTEQAERGKSACALSYSQRVNEKQAHLQGTEGRSKPRPAAPVNMEEGEKETRRRPNSQSIRAPSQTVTFCLLWISINKLAPSHPAEASCNRWNFPSPSPEKQGPKKDIPNPKCKSNAEA